VSQTGGMDQDGVPRRSRAARRAGRVSLRVRLAAAAAGLLAVGAVVIVLAGGVATRDQLTRQARQELRGYAFQLSRHPFLLTPFSPAPSGPSGLIAPAGASGTLSIEVRGAGGQLVMRAGSDRLLPPGLHAAAARMLADGDQPGPVRVAPGGSSLSIAQPVRYRAHRIPYAYSAQDFSVDVTSPAGTGSPGTLVLNLSLDHVSQATGRLTVILLGVVGLLVAAAAALAAWTVRAMLRPLTLLGHRPGGQDRVVPALNATLARLEQAAGPAADPGQASLQAAAQMAAAVASAGQDLRKPLGVLDGLTEYYRHRGQLRPADFERLLARVDDEAAQISSIVDALARSHPDRRTGPDRAGPPGWAENVGGGA
jgi:hypothetical protein